MHKTAEQIADEVLQQAQKEHGSRALFAALPLVLGLGNIPWAAKGTANPIRNGILGGLSGAAIGLLAAGLSSLAPSRWYGPRSGYDNLMGVSDESIVERAKHPALGYLEGVSLGLPAGLVMSTFNPDQTKLLPHIGRWAAFGAAGSAGAMGSRYLTNKIVEK
jgi:hypothetical protein